VAFPVTQILGITLEFVGAENVILLLPEHGVLTGRSHLTQTGCQFVLQLEVLLAHLILELPRGMVLGDNTSVGLGFTLNLGYLINSGPSLDIFLSLAFITGDKGRNGVELASKLPLPLLDDFFTTLLKTFVSLVPLGLGELFQSVDRLLWHLDLLKILGLFLNTLTRLLVISLLRLHLLPCNPVVGDLLVGVLAKFFLDVVCLAINNLFECFVVRIG